jgi:hypothetical protein
MQACSLAPDRAGHTSNAAHAAEACLAGYLEWDRRVGPEFASFDLTRDPRRRCAWPVP